MAVTPANWDKAEGFSKIVPMSGKNKPYEPEAATYPLWPNLLPFEPDTTWYTLFDPKNVAVVSLLTSVVKCTVVVVPVNFKLNVLGNNCSLYLALSTDIAQKSSGDKVFAPIPYVKFVFSSSNTKDLYWPYIDVAGVNLGILVLKYSLPLPNLFP